MRQYIRKELRPYINRDDFIDILVAIHDHALTNPVSYDTISVWTCLMNLIEQQQHLSDKEVQQRKKKGMR